MKKNGAGRPRYERSESIAKQVEMMVACGLPVAEIANILSLGKSTIQRYYKAEVDSGHSKANVKVAEALFNSAIKGNTTAQIFWLKTRARWRETNHVDINVNRPARELSREELVKIASGADIVGEGIESGRVN